MLCRHSPKETNAIAPSVAVVATTLPFGLTVSTPTVLYYISAHATSLETANPLSLSTQVDWLKYPEENLSLFLGFFLFLFSFADRSDLSKRHRQPLCAIQFPRGRLARTLGEPH